LGAVHGNGSGGGLTNGFALGGAAQSGVLKPPESNGR
jgi:hypothetical protein